VGRYGQAIRQIGLGKPAGVAETLDCVQAVKSIGKNQLDLEAAEGTIGCVSKSVEDMEKIRAEGLEKLIAATS